MPNDIKKTEITYDTLNSHQLQAIYKLTRQLASLGYEEDILEAILEDLIDETGAEVAGFIHYDPETDSFVPRTLKTRDEQKPDSIEFSQTVFRQVLESKEAVLTFDTRSDQNYAGTRSVIINKIHAILAFPLIINQQVYGILYFDSRKNRQSFNESARQFLSFFAAIASLALEQVRYKRQIENENILLKSKLENEIRFPTIVGESPVMTKLFRIIPKVALSEASVIITGENGTGKDLVAKAIHDASPRRGQPFLAQYIGTIPATILESELFGYKKGAFTGANADKIGLFEAVNGGTLFLDEIGDLAQDLQAKLLRVLQNKEIKRLGENTIRHVDVRILAATNKDLASMVKEGLFREDLYYRLNVINLIVPPLRERIEDIPLLVQHFLQKENSGNPLTIRREALKMLMNYGWPGNVRQLENIIKRASILAMDSEIKESDIQFDESVKGSKSSEYHGTMEEIKNKIIRQRIEQFKGNKTQAAKSLDISLRSIQAKSKELGI